MSFGARTWSWSREPPEWHSPDPESLTWTCDAASDFWRLTSSAAIKDDGNAYLTRLDGGDFFMTGRFDAVLAEEFDQLGMLVYRSPERWLKAGAELTHEVMFSVVHTRNDSDWSMGSGSLPLEIQIERRSGTLEVRVGPLAGQRQMVRQLRFEGSVSVGLYSCAPTGPGFVSTTNGFRLSVPPRGGGVPGVTIRRPRPGS